MLKERFVYRKARAWFWMKATLALVLALAVFGCAAAREFGRSPDVSTSPAEAPASTAERAEARALLSSLSPASQGLRSWSELAPGIKVCLAYARKKPADEPAFVRPDLTLTWGGVARTNALLLELLPDIERDPGLLAKRFSLAPLGGPSLFTGYDAPTVAASLTPGPEYPYPLYAPPPGPERSLPRHAIDFEGALAGKGLEIAWVRSLADVFFLHIQGSGLLVLPDGGTRYAVYAGNNGLPYTAIGNLMIKDGLFPREEKSMQRIKAVLAARPELVPRYFQQNSRYVYFRFSDQPPRGALGAPFVPLAGAAVDPSFVPMGAVLAFDAALPDPDGGTERVAGLALAQDAGTMRGNHLDLFCGQGEEAAYRAGRMIGQANAYVLVAKEAAP